ncbi:DUF6010 family protein [Kibdelosporangium phytohabitans]|uniref:Uncharacterized protein n=1 Tax=Kibdelosporangium phytohabitans TaxID=860235 RepID=A0A0N9I3W9_9PSEU|nr:DUF6010 family protein [Kibdelosporangium phytohabitans]ALG14645.1 hypothetical protein AOZ06_08915 [Kibdelosporangium phytohabitans]MBE1468326.1 hypothetical protein [Kibdelosporangium phytohabitans]
MTHTLALNGRFARHYAEMVVAMVAGMLLFGPLWSISLGWWSTLARPDVSALVMATNMTVGMSIWMRVRGHGWAPIAEMGAAMYVPFLVLFVPYWLDVISADALMIGGHVLMLPAMFAVMLLRRSEYTVHHHGPAPSSGRAMTALKHRWPTWLALLMTIESWFTPLYPPAIALMVLPTAYLAIGAYRKRLREPGVLGVQLAGFGVYLVLVGVALAVPDDVAKYLIGAGWLLHGAWDYVHHRYDKVVPRAFSEWCGVLDVVVGLTIILLV